MVAGQVVSRRTAGKAIRAPVLSRGCIGRLHKYAREIQEHCETQRAPWHDHHRRWRPVVRCGKRHERESRFARDLRSNRFSVCLLPEPVPNPPPDLIAMETELMESS